MKEKVLGSEDNSVHVVTNRLLSSSEIALNIEVSFHVFPMLR